MILTKIFDMCVTAIILIVVVCFFAGFITYFDRDTYGIKLAVELGKGAWTTGYLICETTGVCSPNSQTDISGFVSNVFQMAKSSFDDTIQKSQDELAKARHNQNTNHYKKQSRNEQRFKAQKLLNETLYAPNESIAGVKVLDVKFAWYRGLKHVKYVMENKKNYYVVFFPTGPSYTPRS